MSRLEALKLEVIHIWNKFTFQNRLRENAAKREFYKVLASLSSSDIAIDLGANVGEFTVQLAETGAQVYAIEPDPHAFSLLQKATAHFSNVTLINAAASDSDGETKLYRSGKFNSAPDRLTKSSSLFLNKKNVSEESGFTVKTMDFSAFIKNLEAPVTLMKVDIEGAEVPLFESLFDQHLIKHVKHSFVETHERDIPQIAARTYALKSKAANLNMSTINWDWH